MLYWPRAVSSREAQRGCYEKGDQCSMLRWQTPQKAFAGSVQTYSISIAEHMTLFFESTHVPNASTLLYPAYCPHLHPSLPRTPLLPFLYFGMRATVLCSTDGAAASTRAKFMRLRARKMRGGCRCRFGEIVTSCGRE